MIEEKCGACWLLALGVKRDWASFSCMCGGRFRFAVLAVNRDGGGAYRSCTGCEGEVSGLLCLQWMWREVGPTELAVGVE